MLSLWLLGVGCSLGSSPSQPAGGLALSPLDIVLAPLASASSASGTGDEIDEKIRSLQAELASQPLQPVRSLEPLGWAFVEKARAHRDAGFYHLALAAADAIDAEDGDENAAGLLRGHALHALHRFAEAEVVARDLVDRRGIAFDHGLLGDVLLDRGDVAGAERAYQHMIDLRPDSRSLARAAQLRFIIGDLEGAVLAMREAAGAASPRQAEAFAWGFAESARFQFAAGDLDGAERSLAVALEVLPEAPVALALRGRLLLARGALRDASEWLRVAARELPSPDALWALEDALIALGRQDEARDAQRRLLEEGADEDARGLALYLATRALEPQRALELAQQEFAQRRDVFTLDALAWAHRANGDLARADQLLGEALAVGTRDARLFLHASVVARERGDSARADSLLARAQAQHQTLLPSEEALLERVLTASPASKSLAAVSSASQSTTEPGEKS